MKRWSAVAVAVVGLLLVGYALVAEEQDEELIRARLIQLEDAVRIDGETSANSVARNAAVDEQFEEIFTKDVTYWIPELTSATRGRRTLSGLATNASSYMAGLDIDFSSVGVQLVAGGAAATVDTVAVVRVTRRGGRVERDDRSVRFGFVKRDDGWQVDTFTVRPQDEEHESQLAPHAVHPVAISQSAANAPTRLRSTSSIAGGSPDISHGL